MSDSAAEAEHELAGRAGAVAPTWLNLGVHGLYRDVRKLIYTKLDAFDRALVEAAHMSNRTVTLDEAFARKCAKRGHLGLLQWARANGCRWNARTCANAAAGGHLHVLQWARESGCPWGSWTCTKAAENGHLEVLQWAREEGCPWDEWTCSSAAKNGDLKVLQWAREKQCPWDGRTSASAAEEATWVCCSGCEQTAASGMITRAQTLPKEDTLAF